MSWCDCSPSSTCENAAYSNHLGCLKSAHERGCPMNETVLIWAVCNNNVEMMEYAHKQGCPWVKKAICIAGRLGHFECLKYAHEHGCPWDERATLEAGKNGHFECLKYAYEHGCPLSRSFCIDMVISYDATLECLEYGRLNGCTWNEEICIRAARKPSAVFLRYLHEQGLNMVEDVAIEAVVSGSVDCLQYAVKNGCPWNPEKCLRLLEQQLPHTHLFHMKPHLYYGIANFCVQNLFNDEVATEKDVISIKCTKCLACQKNAAFKPCGHVIMCYNCACVSRQCPIGCKVDNVIKLYFA